MEDTLNESQNKIHALEEMLGQRNDGKIVDVQCCLLQLVLTIFCSARRFHFFFYCFSCPPLVTSHK